MFTAPPMLGITGVRVGSAVSVGVMLGVGGFSVRVTGTIVAVTGCGVDVEASGVALNLGYPQIATPSKATRTNSIPNRMRDPV